MSKQSELRFWNDQLQAAKSRRDAAKINISSIKSKIAALEAKRTLTPPPADVTFIKFKKQFERHGTVYQYGALKVEGLWYVTGKTGPNGVDWDTLTDFIEKDNIRPLEYLYYSALYTHVATAS